jgi:hypothetical protein
MMKIQHVTSLQATFVVSPVCASIRKTFAEQRLSEPHYVGEKNSSLKSIPTSFYR